MTAEEISAHDWGVERLTVTHINHKINNNKPRSISQKSEWEFENSQSQSSKHMGILNSGFTKFDTCSESNRCCIAGSLSSPFRKKTPLFHDVSYLKKIRKSFSTFSRTFIILLLLAALCTVCSGSKGPLILTDATRSTGFRQFMQSEEETPMGRSSMAIGEYRAVPREDLAFQTLKVIKKWGNHTDILLVGGKNHVYMIDSTLAQNQPKIMYKERLTWVTLSQIRKQCQTFYGNQADLCENFIRVVEIQENGELMVCGTNAFSPSCRSFKREHFNQPNDNKDSLYESESKCRGQCVVPYNPTTASATLYTNTANGYQIFTAVHNDFMSNDPRIMRKYNGTLLSNPHWLNNPTFLKILEYEDKVYVFFREIAKTSETKTSEEITYGRVAQMCKDDPGGTTVLANRWTSFLKARLRCGYSDRQHLEFNNLTSVSEITSVSDGNGGHMDVIFATFTTPWEWSDASLSAVCVFAMKDIIKLFNEGRFLIEYEIDAEPIELGNMESDMSNLKATSSSDDEGRKVTLAYPVPENKVPVPRPGSCLDNPKPDVLFFAKEHPLLYDPIQPHFEAPIFVSYNNLRATQIAVDTNAGDMGKLMIYLGTENGEVLRIRGMLTATEGPKALLVESVQVADKEECKEGHCGVRALHVSRPSNDATDSEPSAFVAFTDYIVQFPLVRCSAYKTKGCCSIDPDCGWDGKKCVHRTYENRKTLLPTSKDTDDVPESCNAIGQNANGLDLGCECDGQGNHHNCHHNKGFNNDGDFTIGQDLLDMANAQPVPQEPRQNSLVLDIESILTDSVLPGIEQQFEETVSGLRDNSQREALKRQLEEALSSTAKLVLQNHRQEYCLPSPTVNHLTHVYPLLLREIELWHETALKNMNESSFDPKCWGRGQNKCTNQVSFSIPLVPVLWEPLKKLIINFSGRCHDITPVGGGSSVFREGPTTRCAPLPGMETCKDSRQPHCYPKRCAFPNFAVDVKAFFRHANDSRQFLHHGDIEPLWKAVNITLGERESLRSGHLPPSEGVRGHLELVVSGRKPFVIDYSPVAEKVKIKFHYSAVRDCALTDPMCIGMAHGCNPDVEHIVDYWFRWTVSKMSHKLRKCGREIERAKRIDERESRKRPGHRTRAASPEDVDFNKIQPSPGRCKRVGGKVKPLSSYPVTDSIWTSIISRSRRTGGSHFSHNGSIEFYNLSSVLQFFKNTCTFIEPTVERKTFRKRASKGRSRSVTVLLQPYVSRDTPFRIQRHNSSGKLFIKYYAEEA